MDDDTRDSLLVLAVVFILALILTCTVLGGNR